MNELEKLQSSTGICFPRFSTLSVRLSVLDNLTLSPMTTMSMGKEAKAEKKARGLLGEQLGLAGHVDAFHSHYLVGKKTTWWL